MLGRRRRRRRRRCRLGAAPRRVPTPARGWSTPRAHRCARGALAADTNYVFQLPVRGDAVLPAEPGAAGARRRRRCGARTAATYAWPGGVGPGRAIVAFSAICAHKLAYPTREVSFIRYQAPARRPSDGGVIHCCADHSVYDPAAGARVVSGPAPQPLAAIVLEYDAATDELFASARWAPSSSTRSSASTSSSSAMEYGQGKAKQPVGERSRRARARPVLPADDQC